MQKQKLYGLGGVKFTILEPSLFKSGHSLKFDYLLSTILEIQLALQIDKIKAILEIAIVNLKPPIMNAWKRIAGLGLTNGDPTYLGPRPLCIYIESP